MRCAREPHTGDDLPAIHRWTTLRDGVTWLKVLGPRLGGGAIEINVLGPVEAWRDGQRLALTRRQNALILGVLALEWPDHVPRERIVNLLWPERPPRHALAVLQTRMSELRTALRGGVALADPDIESARGGYRLNVQPEAVDAWRFKIAVRNWRGAASDDEACRTLRAALDLWRGPVLGEWLPGDVYATLSQLLEALRLTAAEDLFGVELRRGRAFETVDELLVLSAANPARERLLAELMLALHATGRSAEALHHYDRWRRTLREELGADPSSELRALHLAMLNDDIDVEERLQSLVPRSVHSRETYTGTARIPSERTAVPRTLPPDIPDFTGRESELRFLAGALLPADNTASMVAVAGPGGIGKSALCIRLSHTLSARFAGGQIYINLHGYDLDAAVDPATALDRVLRMLNVDGDLIPETLDERAELYRRITAPLNLLVVLDNAASEEQVLPLLPGGPGCGTLINGRTRIGTGLGIPVMDLLMLSDDEAHVLLARQIGMPRLTEEPESVASLVTRCGGLPLALRIVATKIANKPHWRVSRVVRMLDDEPRPLDQLSHAHLDVRTTIALSYNGLGEEEKALLRRVCDLGLHDVTIAAAAALLDVSPAMADDAIENLIDAHLFEVNGVDSAGLSRCRIHDLVRLFGRERAVQEETPAKLKSTRRRAYGLYLSILRDIYGTLFSGDCQPIYSTAAGWELGGKLSVDFVDTPLDWFEVERANIATVVHRAAADNEAAYCWDLACTSSKLFATRSYVQERMALLAVALEAAESASDVIGQAAVLQRLGMLQFDRSETRAGLSTFHRSLSLFRSVDGSQGQAVALLYIGMAERFVGNSRESVRYYNEAVEGFRRTGDGGGEAIALRGIGQAEMDLGDFAAADHFFGQALQLYQTMPNTRLGASQVLFWRGMLFVKLGKHSEAEPLFMEVRRITEDIGDRGGQAQALRGLALCEHGRGNRSAAAACFTAALELLPKDVQNIVEGYIRATIKELGYEGEVLAEQ